MKETDVNDQWYDFATRIVDKKNRNDLKWNGISETEQEIAALWTLEADMYNGGFLQFFCNWGYDAYLHAIRALDRIGATAALGIVTASYAVLGRFENDPRLQQLWDIPKHLTEAEDLRLDELDKQFWQDEDQVAMKAYDYYSAKYGT
ncbi:DMP19 family protein [Paenibacillus sp. DMB20]|uniref:DMP19 family protein n=1 Tax=Paenibacillus sp. DMB20 TaxID=1642570 RepID=UPI00062779BA|nr:DUF4375 domain-containing protein [Paenibacillus sp. DMB20]KKO52137.1 hypothetical protein XI25_22075 [Paenibacillus sp. DMB20]